MKKNPEVEKPQENCPTKNECADLYRDALKAQKRIAELEAIRKAYENVISNCHKQLADLTAENERNREIETKLKFAIEALEFYGHGKIAREALEKLRGEQ